MKAEIRLSGSTRRAPLRVLPNQRFLKGPIWYSRGEQADSSHPKFIRARPAGDRLPCRPTFTSYYSVAIELDSALVLLSCTIVYKTTRSRQLLFFLFYCTAPPAAAAGDIIMSISCGRIIWWLQGGVCFTIDTCVASVVRKSLGRCRDPSHDLFDPFCLLLQE